MSISRVLSVNRGEIAARVVKAAQALGIEAVQAVSLADRESMAAQLADRTVVIGPAPSRLSYLDPKLLVHTALATGCDALHPGYGFLSERAALATLCAEHGINLIQVDDNKKLGEWVGLCKLDKDGKEVPAGRGKRENLSIKLSRDDGKTWPINKTLDAGPSAYSDLAVLPDGTVLCLYEGKADIVVARFNLEWITAP